MRLDEKQRNLYQKFPREHYLSNQKNVERIIDWTTYYRRNLNRFVQHYFGLKLYLYQHILLYMMNLFPNVCLIASRASAKSFLLAVFACARAVLYPGTLVVIASGTKGQAKLMVTEKIQQELLATYGSKTLYSEIEKIIANGNDTEVKFNNGSKITVVAANDNARGHRSHLLIYEEFRMIDKNIVDNVLSPFHVVRKPPYTFEPEYEDLKLDEPVSIYISSAWYKSHWMWNLIQSFANLFTGASQSAMVMALDYSITLRHGIKSREVLLGDKRKFDKQSWGIEYENWMISECVNAFFTYDLLARNQRLKRPLYPMLAIDAATKKKNPYAVQKREGELRVLSCDMAFVERKGNDNSIFSCLRLLPESKSYEIENGKKEVRSGYRKQIAYMESVQGGDTMRQAIRIKQLFYDLECDYIVLDMRNGGITVYDMLAKVMYDPERGVEYPAWLCMNDENTANRIKSPGAEPCLFAIVASQKMNSDIANFTRNAFMDNMVDLLVSHNTALEELLPRIPEYQNAIDLDIQFFFEQPYLETQAFINETIELMYEKLPQTGIIKLSETSGNNKDRYTSVSYGIYFATCLEQDLLSESDAYEACVFIN